MTTVKHFSFLEQQAVLKTFMYIAVGGRAILTIPEEKIVPLVLEQLRSVAPVQPEVQESPLGILLTYPSFNGQAFGKLALLTPKQEETLTLAKAKHEKTIAAQEASEAKAMISSLAEQLQSFIQSPEPTP